RVGSRSVARSSSPAAIASATPCSVRSTSHHPVKRFSRFHWLWPWRTRISVGKVKLQACDRERYALAFVLRFGKAARRFRIASARLRLSPPQVLAQPGRQPGLALRLLVVAAHCPVGLPQPRPLDKTAPMSKARGFSTMLL